jgi:hypothetical protein
MKRNIFFSIRSLITFFGLLLSAHIPAQVDKPKPFNDTPISVHDPAIIWQDSNYRIFAQTNKLAYTFPAHSFTMIKGKIQK